MLKGVSSVENALVSGGALGTPSSGTITNLTGTALGASIGGYATTYPLMNMGGYQFDGSTDYLDGNALTGITDTKKFTFVAFVRFANASGSNEEIFENTGFALRILRSSAGNLTVSAENVGGSTILSQVSTGTVISAAGTYVIMVSVDLATPGSYRCYINDVAPTVTSTTFTDDTIDFTVAEYSLAATVSGTNKMTGDIYAVWFSELVALEFNTESVRRLFADPNNKPVFMGSHAELPTGTPPILFLGYNEFQNWPRNRGVSTSAFVENGTPGGVGTVLYGQFAPFDYSSSIARTTAVGNITTGEDTLMTYTQKAGVFKARGVGLRIEVYGTTANNANAKTIKVYFGATVIMTYALTISIAGTWYVNSRVNYTGVDTQLYSSVLQTIGAAGVALIDEENGTAAEDDGAAIVIKVTGEGVGTNDIIQTEMVLTWYGL